MRVHKYMPDKIYKCGCGPNCVRCWRNRLKHANPTTKAYLKRHSGEFLVREDESQDELLRTQEPLLIRFRRAKNRLEEIQSRKGYDKTWRAKLNSEDIACVREFIEKNPRKKRIEQESAFLVKLAAKKQ